MLLYFCIHVHSLNKQCAFLKKKLSSTSFPLCSWVHCIITLAYPAVTVAGLFLRDRVGQTEETLLRDIWLELWRRWLWDREVWVFLPQPQASVQAWYKASKYLLWIISQTYCKLWTTHTKFHFKCSTKGTWDNRAKAHHCKGKCLA